MSSPESEVQVAVRRYGQRVATALLDVLEGKTLMLPFTSLVVLDMSAAEFREMDARVRRLRRELGNAPEDKGKAA